MVREEITGVNSVALEDIMGRITRDQSHQIVATLDTNADWDDIDFELAGLQDAVIRNPKEAGRRFTAFLKSGANLIVGSPTIIPIDRSISFNPEKFLGRRGWTIWRGSSDCYDRDGEEEQDSRSLAITELDLSKIQLVTTIREDESTVNGEENLRRLREANHICLDAKIFQTLWENKILIPPLFKELTNGDITYIFFNGTTLCHPIGGRFVLYLCFLKGEWRWNYGLLGGDLSVRSLSAVLVSSAPENLGSCLREQV